MTAQHRPSLPSVRPHRSSSTAAARAAVLVGALLTLLPAGAARGQAEPIQVTGTVTSALRGDPVPSVRVTVKGTSIMTLTGANGRYVINVRSPRDTLVFTYIGYAPQEVPVGDRDIVNVTLEVLAVALQEIVVTGYGTQQRRDVTGAVASLDSEDLPPVATASVDQVLQGTVAGVQVTAQSGQPGAQAVVRIRGVGTLNDASPLYVVDGVLVDDISFLQQSDLQSVEVLKDASATAIYGSRGANGVVIITTKRGTLDRPTRFTVNTYAGTQSVLRRIDLVNARDYATLANELAANLGIAPYFDNPDTIGPGTDWQDAIFETAPIQNYQLATSGGSDRVAYYMSANFFRQGGVVPKSTFNRLTLRLNNDYLLTGRLKLGHNLAFSYVDRQRPPSVLSEVYRGDPTIVPQNPDSTFNNANVRSSAGNAAATAFYTRNDDQALRLVGNLFAEMNLLNYFTLRSSFGLDYGRADFRGFTPVFVVSPTQQNTESDLRVETGVSNSWLWENTLTFNHVTEQHRFNLLAGVTAQTFYGEDLGGTRVNIPGEDENLWYLDAGDAEGQTNFNRASDWRMLSYLFRGNYALRNRYLLTASLRVDGSSRFGSENRYGTFPSIALGWNVSEEPFMEGQGLFTALKLRGSWGKIGNDKIGAYPGIPIVTGNLNAVFGPGEALQFGASPIELANPAVKWEQTTQTDVGVDMALLGGGLEATLDWYRRTTDGILVRVPLPSFVGVGTEPFVNAAKVRNTGIEASLAWQGTVGGMTLGVNANGATISNKVLALGEGREEILAGGLGNEVTFTTRTVPGEPIGCFWGYRVLGVFQDAAEIASSPTRGGEQPGDLRYADLNGRDADGEIVPEPDGVVNEDDKTYIGCPIPNFVYGFGFRAQAGAFDFGANFSGQAGNEVFNGKKAVRFGVENFETSYLDRWNGPGTSDTEPRVTTAGHNYQASDRFIEDGSFLKLHTVQVGYRLPRSVTSALRVEQARLYLNATNLFLLTGYSGYTPELTAESVIANGIDVFGGVFPPARTFTIGLDLTF